MEEIELVECFEETNTENIFLNSKENTISVKEWLITLLILAIPILGPIMCFIWAFSNNEDIPTEKKLYTKSTLIIWGASLLFITIIILFCLILFFTIPKIAM